MVEARGLEPAPEPGIVRAALASETKRSDFSPDAGSPANRHKPASSIMSVLRWMPVPNGQSEKFGRLELHSATSSWEFEPPMIDYRGLSQLVESTVWDREVGGSSPLTPTTEAYSNWQGARLEIECGESRWEFKSLCLRKYPP